MKTLTALLFVLVATNAIAFDDTCVQDYGAAEIVMTARQTNTIMPLALATCTGATPDSGLCIELVQLAYQESLTRTEEQRAVRVSMFADRAYSRCLSSWAERLAGSN